MYFSSNYLDVKKGSRNILDFIFFCLNWDIIRRGKEIGNDLWSMLVGSYMICGEKNFLIIFNNDF